MSTWFALHEPQVWSLLTVLFGSLVARLSRLRPRLRYSVAHSTNLLVNEPLRDAEGKLVTNRQIVRYASITVSNSGLQAARNVELTFNWRPPMLNILPARSFQTVDSDFDRYSLKFDSLAPGEQTTVEIMSINGELPLVTSVRSDDCVGRLITMQLQPLWPGWARVIVAGIMLLGAAAVVYIVISLIGLIARHVPG